jgi:hypothetical protein
MVVVIPELGRGIPAMIQTARRLAFLILGKVRITDLKLHSAAERAGRFVRLI